MGGPTASSSRFIAAVVRRRRWVIALWAGVVLASSATYVARFQVDNSVAAWFLDDDPELATYRRHNAEFGEFEWTHLWLRAGSVFAPEFLRDLQALCGQIGALEGVERVVAMTGAGGITRSPSGGLRYRDFYEVAPGELPDAGQAAGLRAAVRGDPLSDGRLVPRGDDRFTVVAIQNANLVHATEPYRIRLIDSVRRLVAGYPTIVDSGFVGTAVINAELNRAALRDMRVYYALITAFVLIGGGLALGRAADLAILCAVLAGTVMPVMGLIAASGLAFNLMTVMLPTLLVTVGASYLIHFLDGFQLARRGGTDVATAISATFQRLLRPGIWTSATTAIGFLSLAASPVAPLRQVGVFAALGIALAWVNAITVAPALLSFTRRGARGGRQRRRRAGSRLLFWLRHPHPSLALALALGFAAGAAGLPMLRADTDYVKFFKRGSEVREDYAQLGRLGMPSSYLTIDVSLAEGDRFAEVARHRAMRRFEDSLGAMPGVMYIESLDRLVEHFATGVAGGAPGPADPGVLGTLLVMAESGLMAESAEFVAGGGDRVRIRAMTGPLSTGDIEAFRRGLRELAAELPEGWEVALTGTNVLWANMDAHVVRTQLLAIGITATALLLLLPVALRSPLLGALGFAASFVPILCTLGLMAWLGIPVNIATCILGGAVVGLSVDDTIYLLSGVRDRLARGFSVGAAVRGGVSTTGRAMTKTSLVLIGGFLTMAGSDFLPSVYFGLFFALSILFALLADLVVLPVVLRLAGSSRGLGGAEKEVVRSPRGRHLP